MDKRAVDSSVIGPASLLQEGLWLSPHAAADPANCNLLWSISLEGACDAAAVSSAVDALVTRHAALRSVFSWSGDGLKLRILPHASADVQMADGGFDRQAFACTPFDLEHGPLYRFRLLRRGVDRHELLCAFHHLVIDGVSWPKLVAEFATLIGGGAPPDAGPDYGQHVAWQTAQLSSAQGHAVRAFWRDKLAALPGTWELPNLGNDGNDAAAVGVVKLPLDQGLSARLRSGAQRLGSTPFRVAMAAFVALLARLARRDDVVLATTLAGRCAPGSRDMVGFFAHTGLIAAAVADKASLADILREVEAQLAELLRHEMLPMRIAGKELLTRFDHARNPLTSVSFTRLPSRRRIAQSGLVIREERVFLPLTERDLTLYFQPNEDCFDIAWVFRHAVMSAAAVRALHGQYCQLLDATLAEPGRPVSEVETLTAEERLQILGTWNDTARPFPAMAPLHQLFEAQVRRTPDAVAVTGPDRSWSYAELEAAANRLAVGLRERGVRVGQFVMLRLNPSFALIAAELGVMKCGAAFVPIGTEWPAPRVAAAAERIGGTPLLLDETGEAGGLPVWQLLEGTGDPGGPGVASSLDDPIYCIFTSGSTGRPKGAVNAHRGVANRLFAMTESFGAPTADTVLATAPATVDTHVWQFFWPLSFGGRVSVAPREVIVTPARLLDVIEQDHVTVLDFVPSLFAEFVALLRQRGAASLARVRLIVLGGEAMRSRDAYAFRAMSPQCRIVNTYGPTETAIGVIFGDLPDEVVTSVPLGRPFANVQAVILQGDRLAPAGVPGELCLGGACVGLGYLNDPAETARVFVPNPFPEVFSARLYRTGDLARMRTDGVIEFLGRIDHQIKIRGVRIEPAEVEAVLARHPAVSAAVAAPSSGLGPARLVAHFTLAEGQSAPTLRALRAHMLHELPVQMVPEAFILHEAFPHLANGKIDRSRVTVSPLAPLAPDIAVEAPLGGTEERLARIWQELLGCKAVGREDNFFQSLGGDSLQAMRLIMRIEEEFGILVNLRTVYQSANLQQLAAAVDEAAAGSRRGRNDEASPSADRSHLVALRAHGSKMPLVLVHGWGGHISHFDGIEQHIETQRPVHGLWCSPEDAQGLPSPSVEALAERYAEQIMARFPGGVHLGGYSAGGWYAYAVAAALLRRGGKVGSLLLIDVQGTGLRLAPSVRRRVRRHRFLRHLRGYLKSLWSGDTPHGRLHFAGSALVDVSRRLRRRARAEGSQGPSEQSDYFVRLLRSYAPPRLRLRAFAIGPAGDRNILDAIWTHYAAGGVSYHPLFDRHLDFMDAQRTPQLSRLVDRLIAGSEDEGI